MYICLYESKRVGVLICLRRVIVSSMLPYSCLQWSICSAYAERGSLFLVYRVCSRNLDFKFRLVCPTYALWQVLHVIFYIPLFSCSCNRVGAMGFMRLCNVVVVLNDMPIFVFLNICSKKKTMTLARHMHYIYFTADMNMVTLTTLWLLSSRSTHPPFCFHINKCTSSRPTIIMNSSPNNIWTSIILCLTSFIQILHVITHLKPNPQSHAFQTVRSQPVQQTATYRVSTF